MAVWSNTKRLLSRFGPGERPAADGVEPVRRGWGRSVWNVQPAGIVVRRTGKAKLRVWLPALRPVDCGWPLIRLGPDRDGGYVVPDDLDGLTTCLSLGVGPDCGFDLALARRGVTVAMADGTVAGPPEDHPAFRFLRKNIGLVETDETTTLDVFAATMAPGDEDILFKMDIEGAEYMTLASMSPALIARCRIMVIEFHDLDRMFERAWLGVLRELFGKLLDSHAIVHLHANNHGGSRSHAGISIPRVIEFTFLRRDRLRTGFGTSRRTPAPDFDNNPDLPPLKLPPELGGP